MTRSTFKQVTATSAIILMAALWGCGTAPQVASFVPRLSTVRSLDAATDGEKAFRAEITKRGIKLTEEQFALIKAERRIQPSGLFAPRPAEQLTAEQNLDVHFKKHGKEFRITSAQDYLEQATAHAAGKRGELSFYFDTTSFQKGYQTHVVRWNIKSKEFGAVKTDGALTTYYLNMSLASSRFVPVPTL